MEYSNAFTLYAHSVVHEHMAMFVGHYQPSHPYIGRIELDTWILDTWIPQHASFATRRWVEQEVRYRSRIRIGTTNHYKVYTQTGEGAFETKVTFEVEDRGTHLFVTRAHAQRKR